jgi:arabinogalactan endo-1,4-beta-galactosidase
VQVKADALEDVRITATVGGSISLPEQVSAIMTDGTTQSVSATWNVEEDALAQMASAEGDYVIEGTADGLSCKAYVTVEQANLLKNPSFEDGDLAPWVLTELGSADQLHVEDKASDSLTGRWHMHFWSAKTDSVEFTLEQQLTDLAAGTYRYNISIMGGDSGDSEIYAYVKINGQITKTAPMTITAYGNWDTAEITEISCNPGMF